MTANGAAVLLAFERLLQARHQIAVPLNIGERFAAGGAVEHLAGIVLEGVMNQYHFVRSYFHVESPTSRLTFQARLEIVRAGAR